MSETTTDRYIDWQRDYNGISEGRLRATRTALRALEAHAGKEPHLVEETEFAAWMESMSASGLHPNTVRLRGNMIRPFFRWAWRERLLDADRMMRLTDVPNPRGSSAESTPKPYSRKEIQQFWEDLDATYPKAPKFVKRWRAGRSRYPRVFKHAMGLQIEAIAMLALHGGMRREEIFRASMDDIHPDNAYVVVRHAAAKGNGGDGKEREVPMTREMRRALAEWFAFRALIAPRHDDPWLCLDPRTSPNGHIPGSPLAPMSFKRFGKLLGSVGPGYELHRLRHTCATEWLRAGMELELVKELLGHARLQQTLAYAKIVGKDVQRAAMRVEGSFTEATAREAA